MKKRLTLLVLIMSWMAVMPIRADYYKIKKGYFTYGIYTDTKTADVSGNTDNGSKSLSSISIPSSVTVTYEDAVANKLGSNYETIGGTYKVTEILNFQYHEMSSVSIPNSIDIIRPAFKYCNNLTSVTIPNSVTYIDMNAFRFCDKLSTIHLPKNCNIGERAFADNPSLTSITIPSGCYFYFSFEGCENLTTVIFEEGVTSTGYCTFTSCSKLKNFTFPSTLKTIGTGCFQRCKFTDFVIPSTVTTIEYGAFANCSLLTSITIPNSVSSLGSKAFEGCVSLTAAKIGNGVRKIEASTFEGDLELKDVEIGDAVTSVGDKAFSGCVKLVDFTSNTKTPPQAYTSTFSGVPFTSATLHVPGGSTTDYKNTAPWSSFGRITNFGGTGGKLSKPTITYRNGKLVFRTSSAANAPALTRAATDQIQYISEITTEDSGQRSNDEVNLTATLVIKVYATADGYEDSDVATATLCWIDSTPSMEGIETTAIAQVQAQPVLVQGINGTITVSGCAEGEPINVYSMSGVAVGSSTARAQQTSTDTNLRKGDIAIVRIGGKSVKVIMQ